MNNYLIIYAIGSFITLIVLLIVTTPKENGLTLKFNNILFLSFIWPLFLLYMFFMVFVSWLIIEHLLSKENKDE
jgi:hypothetical protein